MDTLILPKLPGSGAKVRRWLVEPGARLTSGAPLAIIVTDAVEAVLPAPGDGVLAEVLVREGEALAEDTVLARLEGATAAPRIHATPLARVLAAAHGVDLATISGSGPAGRINAGDLPVEWRPEPVTQVAQQPLEASPVVVVAPQPSISIGMNPAAANGGTLLPFATAMIEADLSAALDVIAAQQADFARRRLELGLTTCMLWAVAAELPHFPRLNAHWSDDGIIVRRRSHLAVAAAGATNTHTWRLISDAGDLNLRGLARALAHAAVVPGPVQATFSVIAGSAHSGYYAGYPPAGDHAAALTFSCAQQRVIACETTVAVRPMATLSLCYDARVCDHHEATAFLYAVSNAFRRIAMV